jgi:hypothetical protein
VVRKKPILGMIGKADLLGNKLVVGSKAGESERTPGGTAISNQVEIASSLISE